MRRGRGRLSRPLRVATVMALIALPAVPPAEAAQEDGLSGVVKTVEEAAGQVIGESGSSAQSRAQVPPDPTTDDDTPGHETPNPGGADHASGGVADVQIDGNDAVTVAHTESTIEDDDSSSSDVTVLAVGGEEIVGAHSDSGRGPTRDTQDPLAPLCEGSGGGICLGLLYADASSTETSSSSSASGNAALAFACLGGTQTDAGAECDGPVSAGVAHSNSNIERNKSSGRTRAEHSNDLVDVCVGGADTAGACSGIGAEAAHSESSSDSGEFGDRGSTERDSYLLGVEANGERTEVVGDPSDLSVPPGCPEGNSLVCVYFNQGESFVFTNGAAGRQETIHLTVGPDLVLGHLATSETLATNSGPGEDEAPPDDEPTDTVLAGGPGVGDEAAGEGDDVLPFTGTEVPLLLALAFALISAGAWLVAYRRRPEGVE